ncbi:MAG: 2-oxo acid dehydrogenase subunit E2 [Anaerolineae bacterium]|nr:2-oxo acid dehydrogenase subunit E2 [Anaerolineae bacterium]
MGNFVMPSLGADMEVGTLASWLVKVGDEVKRGAVIAEVETAKGLIEIEVFEDGVITDILVETDVEVPVGTVLAEIRPIGEPVAVEEVKPVPVSAEEAHPMDHRPLIKRTNGTAAVKRTNGRKSRKRIKASPVAQRLARELGIDLANVVGTGPNGVINKEDVEQAAQVKQPPVIEAPPPPQKPAVEKREFLVQKTDKADKVAVKAAEKAKAEKAALSMRQAIAAAMARSNRDIPHYYLETDIDMSAIQAWLAAENLKRSLRERLLPVVPLIKATALALAKVPVLNGFWLEDELQAQEAINIGFAIALRTGGLVTPALFNVDCKSVDEIMADLSDLIRRTRAGRLRSSELTDATVTLTSLGDMGVRKVYGVIYPPQVALVGFGKVMDRPWAVNGLLGVRPIMTATIAGDHRATDGRVGAQFLDELDKLLQAPEAL